MNHNALDYNGLVFTDMDCHVLSTDPVLGESASNSLANK